MKTKYTPVSGIVLLSCVMQLPCQAGVSLQYQQPSNHHPEPSLLQGIEQWLQPVLSSEDNHPSYRWIETNEKANQSVKQTQTLSTSTAMPQRLALNAHRSDMVADGVKRIGVPGGMFRRVESAASPLSAMNGSSIHTPDGARQAISDNNLLLTANVPVSVPLAEGEVVWNIRPMKGGEVHRLQGRSLPLSLPDGQYDVGLMVGGYEEHRTADVHYGHLVVMDFAADIGVLRVSSDANADWEVFALQNGQPTRSVFSRRASNQLSAILPVGEYEVVASIDNASQRQRLRVDRGTTNLASMNVPTGKVNLVATLGNAPAMRPMHWKLYRLDGGRREVAAPSRHSATLDVAPGHYEAVANLDGRERRREFTVLDGTSNSIVLAMD